MKRGAVALALLAGALAACRGRGVGTYPDAPLLLISIDTLRADRLALYGYREGSTPYIDALGRDGVVFEDVYSHYPLTLPAHASLLTGLLPPRHGVRDNMGFTLKPEHQTLAARFKAAGRPTGGAISAYVLRGQTGLAQGFDFYEDALEIVGSSESLSAIQRDGALAVEALASWIEGQAGRPWFAFLHLYEPHTPYAPPPEYARPGKPYDGEIAYADALVGRLVERLKARGQFERTLIALTGDHGEGLNDHGEEEHGIFLYREALHVPLVLRLPGGARAGTRVAGSVAHVDLTATLLDLAGLPAAGLDGVSLRPALESGALQPRRVYSETLFPRYHFGWSELYSVTDGRQRYVRAPHSELYDLASDPGERANLALSRAATLAELDGWLTRTVDTRAIAAPEEVESETREKLQALGYLGMSQAAPPAGELPDPKDKIGSYEDLKRAMALRREQKDAEAVAQFRKVLAENPRMVDAWELLGSTLVRMGRDREGIAALSEALKLDPDRSGTHIALVKAYSLGRRPDLARAHAELATKQNPGYGYEILAQLMLDLGDVERAAEYARSSLAADPERVMSHFVLGVVAQRAGRYEEALAEYQQAEQHKRRRRTAVVRNLHANMADCLARLGREAEAEREFRAEIETIPSSREGRVGLATLYRSQGRDAEAREVLGGLIAAEPRATADSYWTVVRTFRVLGDGEAAQVWAARARAAFPADARFRGVRGGVSP
jgi:tetratricopeptide (TPR) repeat protein